MSFEIPGFSMPFVAAADLSASQFRFVNVDNTGKVNNPSAGGRAVGVRQNKPKAGEAATVVIDGVSKVEAGAAITAGDDVQTGADGRALTSASGKFVQGVALETASAAGVIIAVLVRPGAAATA